MGELSPIIELDTYGKRRNDPDRIFMKRCVWTSNKSPCFREWGRIDFIIAATANISGAAKLRRK
jgi:hypothetical protein